MIGSILKAASRLDVWLGRQFGRPYHALLAIGLVLEIVQRVREIGDIERWDAGIVRSSLALLLFAALLVHQLGELNEHVERRRRS
jgi:hypothetical protein